MTRTKGRRWSWRFPVMAAGLALGLIGAGLTVPELARAQRGSGPQASSVVDQRPWGGGPDRHWQAPGRDRGRGGDPHWGHGHHRQTWPHSWPPAGRWRPGYWDWRHHHPGYHGYWGRPAYCPGQWVWNGWHWVWVSGC
jgi:hypothetical protein